MNKENVDKYLSALRSGRYKQAYQAFRKSDGSCCVVGVGLDLMVKKGCLYLK
jgi:hypothetical protein